MSALPPKADIRRETFDVRFVPIAAICTAANGTVFDHLIGSDKVENAVATEPSQRVSSVPEQ